jgi:hypothetical protein
MVLGPQGPGRVGRCGGFCLRGSSSVGRARPCQGRGRGFKSRLPLHINPPGCPGGFFIAGFRQRASRSQVSRWPASATLRTSRPGKRTRVMEVLGMWKRRQVSPSRLRTSFRAARMMPPVGHHQVAAWGEAFQEGLEPLGQLGHAFPAGPGRVPGVLEEALGEVRVAGLRLFRVSPASFPTSISRRRGGGLKGKPQGGRQGFGGLPGPAQVGGVEAVKGLPASGQALGPSGRAWPMPTGEKRDI